MCALNHFFTTFWVLFYIITYLYFCNDQQNKPYDMLTVGNLERNYNYEDLYNKQIMFWSHLNTKCLECQKKYSMLTKYHMTEGQLKLKESDYIVLNKIENGNMEVCL